MERKHEQNLKFCNLRDEDTKTKDDGPREGMPLPRGTYSPRSRQTFHKESDHDNCDHATRRKHRMLRGWVCHKGPCVLVGELTRGLHVEVVSKLRTEGECTSIGEEAGQVSGQCGLGPIMGRHWAWLKDREMWIWPRHSQGKHASLTGSCGSWEGAGRARKRSRRQDRVELTYQTLFFEMIILPMPSLGLRKTDAKMNIIPFQSPGTHRLLWDENTVQQDS